MKPSLLTEENDPSILKDSEFLSHGFLFLVHGVGFISVDVATRRSCAIDSCDEGGVGKFSHSKFRLKDHLKIRTSTSGTTSSESSPAITCERSIGVDTISVITAGVRNKTLVDV